MIRRILTLMLVMIFTAGMAYAEERLELSGQMRVQGFAIENYSDLNDDVDTDKESWFAQRFRLGAKLNVMEGVTANLRFDFAEDTWGSDNWSGGGYGARYNHESELQVDRAYLQIDQESYLFKAGQLYQGLGNSIVVDQNTTGMTFRLKLPVTVDLMYAKFSENGSKNDKGANKDEDFYAINAGFAQDNMSFNGFVAMSDNKKYVDDSATTIVGLQGAMALGAVNLNAELDVFFGDTHVDVSPDPENPVMQQFDAVGTQLYVDANATVGNGKVGGLFMYAMGTDKADEVQMTDVSDFGSFSPLSFGILDFTDWGAVEDGLGRSSFAACGDNAGVITLSGYGEMMVVDKLTLRGQLAYSMPSEDKVAELDSLVLLNAGVEYELLKDLSLFLSVQYALVDSNPDVLVAEDDSPLGLATMIRLNF